MGVSWDRAKGSGKEGVQQRQVEGMRERRSKHRRVKQQRKGSREGR